MSLVIGIGHVCTVRVPSTEFGHPENLFRRNPRRCQTMHGFIIHLVHYDNHVETVEILLDDSAGMMGQRIAASLSSNPHPSIRQIAGMTTICSGRINLQRDSYARFFSQTAQYGLGRRRTANIAETNKKNSRFHHDKDNDFYERFRLERFFTRNSSLFIGRSRPMEQKKSISPDSL